MGIIFVSPVTVNFGSSKDNRSVESLYRGHRFPRAIFRHAVWLYHRFTPSFRDVDDPLAERGVIVPYDVACLWYCNFGPPFDRNLRRRQGQLGAVWHVDEVFIKIGGQRRYLWRAVDEDGDGLDIPVTRRREFGVSTTHRTGHYNNRTEVSHQYTREWERQARH